MMVFLDPIKSNLRGRVMTTERQARLRERLLNDDEMRAAISQRAYDIYQRRGSEPGHEIEDWVQAENELLEAMINEESQLDAESSAARVRPADTPSTGVEQKSGKPSVAIKDKKLLSRSGKAAKLRAKPSAAKRAKSRKATKSTTPRKPKVEAAQSLTANEGTAGKNARLIKGKSFAGEQNKQDKY
jgi:hypothetical protein